MTFKSNWEKTDQRVSLLEDEILAMVAQAYPAKQLGTYEVISGGCANLNIKINLISDEQPFILRIYLRDKDAAYREQKLGQLLKQTIPMPRILYIGDYKGYRFAIAEYLPGITLRDLLLSHEPCDLSTIMFDAGKLLAAIQSYFFPSAGFFNKHLKITETISQRGSLEFALKCLKQPTVIDCLSSDLITKIAEYLKKYQLLFPAESASHLVHGDYDPANILVDKKNGVWEIAGILDWEFSFSGSPLFDIATMLRYAHHMPIQFETSFLQGLQKRFVLPMNWRVSVHLLNLLSLLDCLARSSLEQRPNQCKDICAIISHIVQELSFYESPKCGH